MKTKFITFKPEWEYNARHGCQVCKSPAYQINEWLNSVPGIEVLSWQATAVGKDNELYITIQYKEN